MPTDMAGYTVFLLVLTGTFAIVSGACDCERGEVFPSIQRAQRSLLAPVPATASVSAPAPAGTPAAIGAAATVSGAGSTALGAFLQNVLGRAQAVSDIKTSLPYDAVGSGAGQTMFLSGASDYGVSDIPFTATQYSALNRKVVQIPAALNTVSVFVNITGVSKLTLSPTVIANIFNGTITSFADPRILALNPGLTPPTGNNITTVVRGDGSGTTALFTSYLVRAAPAAWPLGSGLTVNFPTTTRPVTGTNSVVAALSAIGNSIGYSTSGAGLAAGLTEVAVQNQAGSYLTSGQGDYDNLASQLVLPPLGGDFSGVNLTFLSGANTYPISGFSYYLVDQDESSNGNGPLLKQLMTYLQTPDVQGSTTISGLRGLPATILAYTMTEINSIIAAGTPAFGLAFSKPANAITQAG